MFVLIFAVFLGGVVASPYYQIENANGFQSFRPIGGFQQHVSHAHFGVEIHFGVFEERVRGLRKTLSALDDTKVSPYLKATFARLVAMVDATSKKLHQYKKFFLGVSRERVEKRQALLFAGVAFSAAALYELHELDSTINEVKNRQNLLVRQVNSLTDDMEKTVRNVKKLYGAIHMIQANAMSQASIITLESAVIEMTSDSQRFFTGLDDLLDHKLSMEIVAEQDMTREFEELQHALREEGFETVFQSAAQVYQLPATFVVRNSSVIIVVKVPVIPNEDVDEFHLFQHLQLPVLHSGHLMEVFARDQMLAINKDRSKFITLSSAEVHACSKMGIQFLCPFVSMASQSEPRDCLKAIFLGDARAMEKSCLIKFLSDAFVMKRINDTAFLVFSRDQSSLSVTCQLDTVLVDVKGMKTVNVKPGCTAFAGGYTFRSAIQPVTRVQHVVSVFPERFLAHLNLSTALINDTLGQYESVDLRALEQGGQKLKNLKAWVIKSQSLVWMWVILAAVLIFIVAIIIVCCVYRKELVRLWRACHSVHENSAHWRRRRAESKSQENYQDQIQELRKMILDMNKQREQDVDSVSVQQSNTVSTVVDNEYEVMDEDDKSLVYLE